MLEKELARAGFTSKEARIYLAILELGETSIIRIAKKSAIKRTTVYLTIESLQEKGYISTIKRGNKTAYFAEDPRAIIDRLDDNKRVIEAAMPQLLSFSNLIDKKPKIRYFEGWEGMKEIYKDTLKYPNREMLSWFSESAYEFDENFFLNYYVPKRVQKKIWVRALLADSLRIREIVERYDKDALRTSRLISSEKFKMPIDITLYSDNKIGLFSYEEEIGVMIESKKIYESLRGIFEVMWELIPPK